MNATSVLWRTGSSLAREKSGDLSLQNLVLVKAGCQIRHLKLTTSVVITVLKMVRFAFNGFSGSMVHSTGVFETMLKGSVIMPEKSILNIAFYFQHHIPSNVH